ncbi:MAG: hypothetical protein FJ098_02675 [Deltaproteobacteria bacterium]|nr:hypothetical protein [Deltaproteobacteria bacterium]
MRCSLSILSFFLISSSCDPGEPEDMATTNDPEAYCRAHPGAMPDCEGLDLEACEAHPFCSPKDAIECGWTDPPGYEIVQVGCGTTKYCSEDGSGLASVTCNGSVSFGRSPDTGVWYLFFDGCGPDGWEAAGNETVYCEVPP